MVQVTILGRLGKDPEVKNYGDQGKSLTRLRVAAKQGYKDKETTSWFNVTAWGKQGEVIAKHFVKGNQILFNGKLEIREYETEDGSTGKSVDINLENFYFTSENGSKKDSKEGTKSIKEQDKTIKNVKTNEKFSADNIPF